MLARNRAPLTAALNDPERRLAVVVDLRAGLQRWRDEFAPRLLEARAGLSLLFFRSELPEWTVQPPFTGIPCGTSESLLSGEEMTRLDETALEWAEQWHRVAFPGTDHESALEAVLGDAIEINVLRFLIPRLKNTVIIERWVERERPDSLFIYEDTEEIWESAALVAAKIRVPVFREDGRKRRRYAHVDFERQKDSYPRIQRRLLHGLADRLARRRLARRTPEGGWALLPPSFMRDWQCHYPLSGASPLQFRFSRGLREKIRLLRRDGVYLPLDLPAPGDPPRRHLPTPWGARAHAALDRVAVYEGLSFAPMLAEFIRPLAEKFYPRVVSTASILRWLHAGAPIRLAAVPTDVKHDPKLIVLLCRALGVPTATLQHGVLGETCGWSTLRADRVAVWGEEGRHWYGSHNGVERCVITGYPRYEELKGWIRKFPAPVGPPPRRVLFISQAIGKNSTFAVYDEMELILRHCLRALPALRGAELVVRPHPREEAAAAYEALLREVPGVTARVEVQTPLWPLIRSSGCVVLRASTVGVEAMLLRVPVILVNLTARADMVPYAEQGAAIGVHSAPEFLSALDSALSDAPSRQALLDRAEHFARDYISYDIDARQAFGAFLSETAVAGSPVITPDTVRRQ